MAVRLIPQNVTDFSKSSIAAVPDALIMVENYHTICANQVFLLLISPMISLSQYATLVNKELDLIISK
ncbi:MAG: hypothetical protein H9535_13495 [Ignavibacteria bacterium]|nr:hypothetical protein [Ignavibacteria bacterium]